MLLIGFVCGGMSLQPGGCAGPSPNFVVILTDDQSWVELYDDRSDPNEHHNLASDPKFASIKKKLGAAMPTKNVVPKEIAKGETDSYGRKYERLRNEGIPDWLGTMPKKASGEQPNDR